MKIEIIDTLANLVPVDLVTNDKIRIGAVNDGGYVMVDLLAGRQPVLSYGLSWNVSFDYDLAERGHALYMFDHTIDGLSAEHANFNYFKEGVGTVSSEDPLLHTVDAHLQRLGLVKGNLLLKMDVEGAEWDVLDEMSEATLLGFEQIVLELHDFARIGDKAWRDRAGRVLGKLARHFHLHHVHANNFAPIVVVAGVPVADVIEVSYVRAGLVEVAPSRTLYPTAMDGVNDVSQPDHILSFFPFHPTATGRSLADDRMAYRDHARRIEQEQVASQQRFEASQAALGRRGLPRIPQTVAQGGGAGQRILLLSVHPVLEYDQIRIFEGLGHQVYSLGFYTRRGQANEIRPALPGTDWHEHLSREFEATGCRSDHNGATRWRVTPAFMANFDLVIVDHETGFIVENWPAFADVPVVWRTIGQDSPQSEAMMRPYRRAGLKIVRWSPEQVSLPGYIGGDSVIHASADPDFWDGWTGDGGRIVSFNNDFRARGHALSYDFWNEVVEGLPIDLYGLRNDDLPQWRGAVSPDEQIRILRAAAAAFITGTQPAPYTLGFIEAWMLGVPVVHVGRQTATGGALGTFEIDRLIRHGENGFLVDTVEEARAVLASLLDDADLRARISQAGRQSAIEYFALDHVTAQWRMFLSECVGV